MRLFIAEKPNLGKAIANGLGNGHKDNGCIRCGNDVVTWCFGHMLEPAYPQDYKPEYAHWRREHLPIIPASWKYTVKRSAAAQLKLIGKLLGEAASVVNAGDPDREGQLLVDEVLEHFKYRGPVARIWLPSLDDRSVQLALKNITDNAPNAPLRDAARARMLADWLVGMNASRALAAASGSVNNSIGRVQTPTLAMICARFKENRNFVSTPYWQLHIVLKRDNGHRQFIHTKEFKDKNMAEAAYKSITPGSVVTITKVKRGKIFQQAPLLYDLTALQKDCNIHYDLPVDKTLAITQSLYEKKLVSYPRTGSRYIPQDVMAHIPVLLEKITAMPEFREYRRSLDLSALNTRSVDAAKVTDHHALIITGIVPEGLSEAESTVYTLIAGRMLEAFSPPCEKELLLMECVCGGLDFHSRSTVIANPGWRAVFSRKEDREKDEPERDEGTASFTEGEEIPVMGHGLSQKKTLPKPLYTEATLLRAMETAGKLVDNDELRDALKENGIGRPSTRAAIIETLFKRNYIRKEKKNLIATPTGVELIQIIHEELLKSAELTGIWEKKLREIEKRTYNAGQFLEELKQMVSEIVMSVLSDNSNRHITIQAPVPEKGKGEKAAAASDKPKKEPKKRAPRKSATKKTEQAAAEKQPADALVGQPCPLCGKGTVIKGKTAYGCSEWKSGCTFRKPFE